MAAPDITAGRVRARRMTAPTLFSAWASEPGFASPGRTAASPTPSTWRTCIADSEVTSVGIEETSVRRGHHGVNPPQVRLI